MARTVGAIERDLDNALGEANRGVVGAEAKLEALRSELADLAPQPEPEPVEEAPAEVEAKPKRKTAKK